MPSKSRDEIIIQLREVTGHTAWTVNNLCLARNGRKSDYYTLSLPFMEAWALRNAFNQHCQPDKTFVVDPQNKFEQGQINPDYPLMIVIPDTLAHNPGFFARLPKNFIGHDMEAKQKLVEEVVLSDIYRLMDRRKDIPSGRSGRHR